MRLAEKSTDELIKLFNKYPDILLSKRIKARINIFSNKTIGCHLYQKGLSVFMSNPSGKGKDYCIEEIKEIGSYNGHAYYQDLSTKKAKYELKDPVIRVLDIASGKYVTKEKLNNLVVKEKTISWWYDYFTTTYKVYYNKNNENLDDDKFLKDHTKGVEYIDKINTKYFYSACKILCDKFPKYASKMEIKNLLRDYKTVLDYCDYSQDIEIPYLLGIIKNIINMGICGLYCYRTVWPDYIYQIKSSKRMTIKEFVENGLKNKDKNTKKIWNNLVSYEELVHFQNYTDEHANKYDTKGNMKEGLSFVFISYIDVPWAIGHAKIMDDLGNKDIKRPEWIHKNWYLPSQKEYLDLIKKSR